MRTSFTRFICLVILWCMAPLCLILPAQAGGAGNFITFRLHVLEAARQAHIAPPEIVVGNYALTNVFLWLVQKEGGFEIRIDETLLADSTEAMLSFFAYREVCRIELEAVDGPTFGEISDQESEICAYDILGHRVFTLMALDAYERNRGFPGLRGKTREQADVYIRELLRTTAGFRIRGFARDETVTGVLRSIMDVHESRLGVRYNNAPPPRIVWQPIANYFVVYSWPDKTIYIHSHLRACNFTLLAGDVSTYPMSIEDSFCNLAFVRNFLSNALGQYLTHLEVIRMGGSWVEENPPLADETLDGTLASTIVLSGIGKYFEVAFVPQQQKELKLTLRPPFTRTEFLSLKAEALQYIDEQSYYLVEGILRQRVTAGMAWLLKNPLKITIPDFSGMHSYRERAKQELSR